MTLDIVAQVLLLLLCALVVMTGYLTVLIAVNSRLIHYLELSLKPGSDLHQYDKQIHIYAFLIRVLTFGVVR